MRTLISFILIVSMGYFSLAQTLESFNFSGALNANGWSTHSGIAGQFQALTTLSDCQNSLYLQGFDPAAGNRTTFTAGNTEDVNKALTGITGIGYYSFLLKVSNTTGLSTAGEYFTGFGGTAGATVTVFAPRVFVKAGVTPNTFSLGIQNTTGGTPTPTPTYSNEYPVGTTVLVVVKLDATTSPIQASLFINPIAGATEPTASVTNSAGTFSFANFASIFLRQAGSNTSGTGNLQIDEIRVGSTWESVTPACQQILTWYPDADADGFGATSPILQSCCQPAGYVANNNDCDDNNASINPNSVWYADLDGDGFGNLNSTQTSCIQPQGYVLNSTDCDDNNLGVNTLSTWYQDSDQDGFGNASISISNCGQPTGYVSNATDCDDSNNQINPNVTEIADNIDNDCDGLTDEGFALLTWYLDNDQDGFGGASSVQSVLSPGSNYILQGGDCDDSNNQINPNAQETCDGIDNNCDGFIDNGLTFTTYYADVDGDTYGNINDSIVACTQPSGYVLNNTDCDDTNSAINPEATDIPINGIDEDCNGVDAPLLPLNLGMYTFTGTTDCVTQDNSVTTQPQGATFSSFNGVGTNCAAGGGVFNRSGWNGLNTVNLAQYNEFSVTADNCKKLNLDRVAFKYRPSGSAGSPVWHLRSSVDNFAADIDFGTGINVNNAYLDDTVFLVNHNNLDQVTFRFYITEMLGTTTTWRMDDVSLYGNIMNLTPQLYYADGDGDGYGNPLVDSLACSVPQNFVLDNSDCDDANNLINPLTVWYFDNDGDQIGNSTQTFIGCSSPVGYVLDAGDCDDNNTQVTGPVTYYADVDSDGFGSDLSAQQLCQNPGAGYVTVGGDCDDANPLINPNATEVCDGIDNDCDGIADDGLVFAMYYVDADGDGFGDEATGVESCSQPQNTITTGGDCDDTNDQIYPGATEVCDGVDNDCDGSFDEGLTFITYYTDADNDGFGTGSTGLSFCEIPGPGFSTNNQDCDDTNGQINPNATDATGNGIDENCDGVDGVLGIESAYDVNVVVSPNPNSGSFTINFNQQVTSTEIKLTDLNGKVIRVYHFSGDTINISNSTLEKGFYLLNVSIDGKILIERILVQ
ncbi:MAG: T9SS type A sorting domain-containing protein [Bacteroidetes bacterium]|nr:T9SS type A sorting domain-containing protein [Bacteroidota bacterium]